MALDTFTAIANKVVSRCPVAGILLARDWVKNSFRELSERRFWSWLVAQGQFLPNAVYNAGTVAVTRSSTTVTGTGTVFTAAMVGRQFAIGKTNPIYTISTRTSNTVIDLDQVWGGSTLTGQNYEIFNAYHTVPAGFHSYISVWDPNYNWQLWLDVPQEELNAWDAQRSNSGTTYVVASHSYDTTSPPLPRYEFWPHQKADYAFPYLYNSRATDLDDSGATLPRLIRGDVLLEMALEKAAAWPGPSRDRPNPYHKEWLVTYHHGKSEDLIRNLERQDDEVYENMVSYSRKMPFAPFFDAEWMQKHGPIW